MDDYIEVKIDVFEHTAQRARLRKTLTVSALIDEIFKEFDDIAADAPGKYALYLKGNDRPLTTGVTLAQLDIQPQDELVFNYIKQTLRQMLDPRDYAFLRDDSLNRVYEIQWQPAIIGRPTNEADHNIMLAVNLQLHPLGQTVSRKHAQITFSQGSFYIEPLAENNPILVNGKVVPLNNRKEIKNSDRILLGRNNLLMVFNTQTVSPASPAREQRSQPGLQPYIPPISTSQPARESSSNPVFSQSAPIPIEAERTFIATSAPLARLVVERALVITKAGQRLDLVNYPFVLGRDLPILSGEGDVSRRHAEINFDSITNKFSITDLQSTNGVSLDGIRVEPNRPYELRVGMRIGFGQHLICRFEN
jgi:pSer/pThr/pTyr-binding forkhead associated (FHA) protein